MSKIVKNWREFKKVELHRHLDCCVRLSTVLDVAAAAGVRLPATTVEGLKEYALVLKPMKDLTSVLKKFLLVQSVLATPEILERVAYENCIDAHEDGIRVLELRYSPAYICLNHPKLNYDSVHRALCDGIGRAQKELQGRIAVGLIGIITRDQPLAEARKTADFVLSHRDSFVGFDLAGDEVAVKSTVFKKQFEGARAAGLGITVHSGEANVPGSARFVRESIEELGASRIGHGVQIIHDPAVMDFVREKGVTLEVCPTSNVLTNAVPDLKSHPIRKFMDAGLKVTLNSDDPHIFGIDLTHEYEVLNSELGFQTDDFERLNAQALKSTFIEPSEALKAWNS